MLVVAHGVWAGLDFDHFDCAFFAYIITLQPTSPYHSSFSTCTFHFRSTTRHRLGFLSSPLTLNRMMLTTDPTQPTSRRDTATKLPTGPTILSLCLPSFGPTTFGSRTPPPLGRGPLTWLEYPLDGTSGPQPVSSSITPIWKYRTRNLQRIGMAFSLRHETLSTITGSITLRFIPLGASSSSPFCATL